MSLSGSRVRGQVWLMGSGSCRGLGIDKRLRKSACAGVEPVSWSLFVLRRPDHHKQGGGMTGCLGYKSVWCRKAKEACEESGNAEQEKVIMESRRFAKRKFGPLRHQGLKRILGCRPTEQEEKSNLQTHYDQRRIESRARARMAVLFQPIYLPTPRTLPANFDRPLLEKHLLQEASPDLRY